MEEIQRPLEVIESEINDFTKQIKQDAIAWGKLALGEDASILDISKYVGEQLGLGWRAILEIITDIRVVK